MHTNPQIAEGARSLVLALALSGCAVGMDRADGRTSGRDAANPGRDARTLGREAGGRRDGGTPAHDAGTPGWDTGTSARDGGAPSLPIPGGSAGQPGATGWQHTGVVLHGCENLVSGGKYVLAGLPPPGRVVDGCDFSGKQVRITGGGEVILRRSRVVNNDYGDTEGAAIYVADGAGPVTIEDVEIDTTDHDARGGDPSAGGDPRQDRTIAVRKNNALKVIIRRVYAHDTTRGIDITSQNNIEIVDTYHGPNVSPPVGQRPGQGCPGTERKHSSAIRAAGSTSNIVLRNTVLHIGPCAFASGLIATYQEQGPGGLYGYANHDWEIDGGLWIHERDNPNADNTGGYGIAAGCDWYGTGTGPTRYQNYNLRIHDLKISTQYNSDGCPAGCAQGWNNVAGDRTSWSKVTKFHPGSTDDGQPITVANPQGGISVVCPRPNG